MNKILSLLATIAAITLPHVAKANDGLYVGGMAGVNFADIRAEKHHATLDTKAGYTLGGVIGYRLCDDFRLEGEVSYRRNSLKHLKSNGQKLSLDGHLRTWSFMANGYYDFPVDWMVAPYVGAGIGYDTSKVSVKHDSESAHGRKNSFAWQLMAGLNYDLSCDVQTNLEYKFHHQDHTKIYEHAVTFGMKKFF